MALFSNPDEKDIEKRRQELDEREVDLERRQATLDQDERRHKAALEATSKKLEEERAALDASRHEQAQRDSHVFEREQALSQGEAAAKAGSVELQREAFREVIESRTNGLDARQKELEGREQRLVADMEAATRKEGALASREMAVKERELKADAGFAEKQRLLLDELQPREQSCEQWEEALRKRETDAQTEYGKIEHSREELRRRAEQLAKSEQERDAGYAEMRRKLDQELHEKHVASEEEITQFRAERLARMEKELGGLREKRLLEITEFGNAEQQRIRSLLDAERKQHDEEVEKERKALDTEREKLRSTRVELDTLDNDLIYRRKMLDAGERQLEERHTRIEAEVAERVLVRQQSFSAQETVLNDEITQLRGSLASTRSLLGVFEELKQRLGDEPEKVLRDLNAKTDEIKVLREELVTRPTQEVRERLDNVQLERDRLAAQLAEAEAQAADHRQRLAGESALRAKVAETEMQNKSLIDQVKALDGRCNFLGAELKRVQSSYEREQDREVRIRDIEAPERADIYKMGPSGEIDEIQWLDGIAQRCIDYGLRFHPRILRAFHTSLKTAEWSPMTILAGVSGTGKSELPRLYSHFGGMPFLPISVQPNWDSQESMLGFFNSIDNKFDAQPILRFLAQTQKKRHEEYPGLEDAICMVLLDEMNLAHAELYFAEFLSKLELRRGSKDDKIPHLDVKLGAGLAPYPLPLGRNVLWTGTMNQDETTKSLSDKVLDRAIVIHFPRPTKLERRLELKQLPPYADLLPRKVWQGWWSKKSDFTPEEVQPFIAFVEEMNGALSQVGRALGHRVWQSVEYYMANYPDVRVARKSGDGTRLRQAMRTAFEDQLVQKVMPKLRGIETRGKSKTHCLDIIRGQIERDDYQIVDDFNLACEFGHGQFIWQSANYLQEESPGARNLPGNASHATGLPADEKASAGTLDDPTNLATPPDDFKPGDPNRQSEWDALSPKQQKMFKNKRPR